MANDTSKVKLPHKVVTSIINKAKDTSTIAALSPSTPQTFSDTTYIVFNPTTEAEVVAEGAKKSGSEVSTTPIRRKAREGSHDHTRLRRAALGRRGQPA